MTKNNQEVDKVEVSKASVEAMADNIAAIARAARDMEKKLTRRALLVLIQDLTGGTRGVSLDNISKVLTAIQSLNVYVKGKNG